MVIVTIIMCIRVACAALTYVIRFAAIIETLDSSNNHANWPIPEAVKIWEHKSHISSVLRHFFDRYFVSELQLAFAAF